MARVEVSRVMAVPHNRVWDALADLSSHARWMKEAIGIEFETDQRRGPGTSMVVETRVGPFRTTDLVRVTGWVEGESIDVVHTGMVKGEGTLSAKPDGDTTRVAWAEDLYFPWWLAGPIGAWIARPILAAIWRGNLERLESIVSRSD